MKNIDYLITIILLINTILSANDIFAFENIIHTVPNEFENAQSAFIQSFAQDYNNILAFNSSNHMDLDQNCYKDRYFDCENGLDNINSLDSSYVEPSKNDFIQGILIDKSSIHDELILNNKNEQIDDCFECLDDIDVPEISKEELDKCSPVTMDFNSLNELLKDTVNSPLDKIKNLVSEIPENTKFNFVENHLNQNISLLDMLKGDIYYDDLTVFERKTKRTYSDDIREFIKKKNDILMREDKNSDDYMIALAAYIEKLIKNNIPDSYVSNHIRSLNNIKMAREVFDKFSMDRKTYLNIFEPSHDKVFIKKLKILISRFDETTVLNEEICDKFLSEFDKEIFDNSFSLQFRWKIEKMMDLHKRFLFYSEFMRIYLFAPEMPELLTFGGLFEIKSFFNVVFVMHLIMLSAYHVGDLKENKTFILCMIFRAFRCFYGNRFDIFRIPKYEFICDKARHDVTHISLEFNSKKRRDIGSRKKFIVKSKPNDKNFIKIVLLIYLYQHSLFFKYYHVNDEMKSFEHFVDTVLHSTDCVGCLMNQFFDRIRISVIKL